MNYLWAIAAALISFYIFHQMRLYFIKANEKNLIEYQNELLNNYILCKESSDKEIRMLNHDLKHYLINLKTMIEDGNIEAALESITEYHQSIVDTNLLDAGIPVATAIINGIFTNARQNNIKFRLDGSFEDGILMESTDIGVLIGNILENALEAVTKVRDPARREIDFSIKRDNQFLYLEVENSYEYEPDVKNHVFITSKANRVNHGIGMLSINRIVKKYKGVIEVTYEKGWFVVFVMLPVYDKTL